MRYAAGTVLVSAVLALLPPPLPKGRMPQRARAYGRRILDLHTIKDAARLATQTRLDQIDRELEQLEPIPTMLRRLRYVDLTGLIDLDVDATAGAGHRTGPSAWPARTPVCSSAMRSFAPWTAR